MIKPKDFFSPGERLKIENAIKKAELNTSGEIRVHIAEKCTKNVLDCAVDIFAMLKMHKTKLRNGVLFYLSINDRKFAVIGDAGINSKVPENFWDEIKETVLTHFKKNEYATGLEKGILMAGEQLKKYFPYQTNDINELSDEISFEK
jgi:uncharacterized membrane protein